MSTLAEFIEIVWMILTKTWKKKINEGIWLNFQNPEKKDRSKVYKKKIPF